MKNERLERLHRMLQSVEAKTEDLVSSKSTATSSAESLEIDIATETLDSLLHKEIHDLDQNQQLVMEKIVMPYYRPVVDIMDGRITTAQLGSKWRHLGEDSPRHALEAVFNAVGRVEIPNHPRFPYAGSAFLVSRTPDDRGILMTNRHVAEIFSTGIGISNLRFRPGQTVAVDFLKEVGSDASDILTVENVLMIHPDWDMALLQVTGLAEDRKPLQLSAVDPKDLQEREIVTIGYPGYDVGGDRIYQETQSRIFRNIYYVKRLQPGILKSRDEIASYDRTVSALTHDCSTAGGNSGSCLILVPKSPNEPVQVIGLHFAGIYLLANYAVSTYDLASDNLVVDTGIEFFKPKPLSQKTNLSITEIINIPVASADGTTTCKIPLEISVSVGTPEILSAVPAGASLDISVPTTSKSSAALEEGLFGSRSPDFSLDELKEMFSLSSLAENQFNWKTALSLAVASELVYKNRSVVERTAKDWGLSACRFIAQEETQCFIASYEGGVLISFRGSESLGDWLANMRFFTTEREKYGAVHEGFYNGFADVRESLEEELELRSPDQVLLTGHSLGGALATIAAAEWKDKYNVSAVYTFGQPAVGKTDFETFFRVSYSDKFFRFVNDDDIVTRLPPLYNHLEKLYHFDSGNGLRTQTESLSGTAIADEPKMMSEQEFANFQLLTRKAGRGDAIVITESVNGPVLEGFLPSVSDHSLGEYIKKIRNSASAS